MPHFVRYLAGLTLASSVGLAEDTATEYPVAEEMRSVAVDATDVTEELDGEGRADLLERLAQDPRPALRGAVTEVLLAYPQWAKTSVLAKLVTDTSPAVRNLAHAAFAATVESKAVIDRLQVLAQWALADNPWQRTAAANALACSFPVPAAEALLSHLAHDPSSRVRYLAIQAATERFAQWPETLREVVEPALQDRNREVRRNARRAYLSSHASA